MNKKNVFIKTLAFGIVGFSLTQGAGHAQGPAPTPVPQACLCSCTVTYVQNGQALGSKQSTPKTKVSGTDACINQCAAYYSKPNVEQVFYELDCGGSINPPSPPPPSKRK